MALCVIVIVGVISYAQDPISSVPDNLSSILSMNEDSTHNSTSIYPVRPTIPGSFEELTTREYPVDLSTPSNIRTRTEYIPEMNCYAVRTILGDKDIVTPMFLSPQQYEYWQNRAEMQNLSLIHISEPTRPY